MNDTKRYDDDEVARIFDQATAEQNLPATQGPGFGSGLTLDELKDIAAEVGIEPHRIERAAQNLQVRPEPVAAVETFLGAPRSVSHTVPLPRTLTDDEWSHVVALARQTFGAQGKLDSAGALRSWRNSNLSVNIEATADGHQLRMRTRKGNVTQFSIIGGVFAAVGAVNAIGALLGFGNESLVQSVTFLGVGLGLFGWSRLSLPGWAQLRMRQFEDLGDRVRGMLGK